MDRFFWGGMGVQKNHINSSKDSKGQFQSFFKCIFASRTSHVYGNSQCRQQIMGPKIPNRFQAAFEAVKEAPTQIVNACAGLSGGHIHHQRRRGLSVHCNFLDPTHYIELAYLCREIHTRIYI